MTNWSLLCTALVLSSASSAQALPSTSNETIPQADDSTQLVEGGTLHRLEYRLSWSWELMKAQIKFASVASFAPFVVLMLIPISRRRGYENRLRVLLAFALGKRLTDALVTLFEDSTVPEEIEDGFKTTRRVAFFLGALAFFGAEKFIQQSRGTMASSAHEGSRVLTQLGREQMRGGGTKQNTGGTPGKVDSLNPDPPNPVEVGAYLNLAAYFLHNLFLGLVIGASFGMRDAFSGAARIIVVFLHKFPHDIGDFALLIQNGMRKRQALFLQLLSNAGTFAGAFLGHMVRLDREALSFAAVSAMRWLYNGIIGGLFYLVAASASTELLRSGWFWQTLMEILAFLLGAYLAISVPL